MQTKQRLRKPLCKVGTPCGLTCVSKTFSCVDELSPEAKHIAANLVSLAGVLKASSHYGSLYSYTDGNGRQYFAKRFASIDESGWQRELRAYKAAEQLGIQGMLVKPKLLPLSGGRMLLLWPMLRGHTLREHKQPLTEQQRTALAVARQFDEYIGQVDRNLGNVWITDTGKIKLIDHDLAFTATGPLQDTAHASGMTLAEAESIFKLSSININGNAQAIR